MIKGIGDDAMNWMELDQNVDSYKFRLHISIRSLLYYVNVETIWKNTEGFLRWENHFQNDLKEIGVDMMNWMDLDQNVDREAAYP